MQYGMWLSFNNRAQEFQVPINPEQLEIGDTGQGKTYEVVGLGEINVIKNPRLAEYSWSGIFPARRYPWVVSAQLLPPFQYVDYVQRWMATGRPIRFVFIGASFGINTPASIESFQWREVAGADGDIEYSIKLKRYTFYAAQRVQVAAASASTIHVEPPPRPDDRQPPETYTLVAGDTLWELAQRFLGDGSRWPEIQRLNAITDAQIRSLPVGQVLRLPGGVPGE